MGSLETPTFTVPTIDLSAYLKDPQSNEANEIVDEIRAACEGSGFFQLVGHGVPETLQSRAFTAAKTFFKLPENEKLKLRGRPGRGYELIGTQFLEPGKNADLKEGFSVSREIPNQQPPYRKFEEPNVWPSAEQIPESQFKAPLLEYHQELWALSEKVMKILATGMSNLDTSVFDEFCKDPIASMRILHYPPHPESDDEKLVGTGAHTDFGAITLLLQNGQSGLQVWNRDANEWFDVQPTQNAFVVNVGDFLDIWTGERYKSTVHRVINKSGTDRYSIPFFFDGNLDCRIQCLDRETGGNGKSFTVDEHLTERMSTYT